MTIVSVQVVSWRRKSVAVLGGYAYERREEEPLAAPLLRSQLTTMVLGLVIEKPSHGYEIGLRFEDRFGGFLRAGRSSIYPALQRLVHDGLIEKMPAASTMTAARRGAKAGACYRATAQGARAYRAWLAERFRSDPQRVEMLGRMALAGVHSVEAALDFLDRYEQACVREARTLVPSPEQRFPAASRSPRWSSGCWWISAGERSTRNSRGSPMPELSCARRQGAARRRGGAAAVSLLSLEHVTSATGADASSASQSETLRSRSSRASWSPFGVPALGTQHLAAPGGRARAARRGHRPLPGP